MGEKLENVAFTRLNGILLTQNKKNGEVCYSKHPGGVVLIFKDIGSFNQAIVREKKKLG